MEWISWRRMFFLVRYCWVGRCVIYRCRVCNRDIRAIFLDKHPPSNCLVVARVPSSCATGAQDPVSSPFMVFCCSLGETGTTCESLLVQFVPPSRGQHIFFSASKTRVCQHFATEYQIRRWSLCSG